MHRIKYTKLTPEQIAGKLRGREGPTSASPLSDVFAGKSLKIVLDDGPALSYRFTDGRACRCRGRRRRGAGGLRRADARSHRALLAPGAADAARLHVVVDQDTNLATVFEVWFSGYTDNREVQRQVYYGYVEQAGQPAPTARHGITNRIEGKGFYWKQDTGIETLEYYPTVLYSNFVELTRFGGELSFCAPSDYIKISDDKYIYSRVEARVLRHDDDLRARPESRRAGRHAARLRRDRRARVLRVPRARRMARANRAVRAVRRRRHDDRARATGGAAAGEGRAPGLPADEDEPGDDEARRSRPRSRRPRRVFPEQNAMAGNKGPVSGFLKGKELTLRYDNGLAFNYRFDDVQKLRWRREAGDSAWRERSTSRGSPRPASSCSAT